MKNSSRGWLLCALFSVPAAAFADARQVRDDSGANVAVSDAPCRIVSLAPGTTAMLFAAGAGHCLVGTIAHSDEPAEAARVPVVGDAETLDFEHLLSLRPTLVVVSVDVVQRSRVDRIRSLGIPVYQVHVTRLAQMPRSLRQLGMLTGTSVAADAAAARLEARLAELAAQYRGRKPLRVFYQIWDKPIYTIGGRHLINDALALCGATNIFADLETAAPAVTRESVVTRNPELIVLSSPPAATADWQAEWRKYPAVSAVGAARVVSFSDARIDRMGPSVVAATASLCELVENARSTLAPQAIAR